MSMPTSSSSTATALPDQTARTKIAQKLDCNFLVEAAAGTGKTTSMVGRMVALIRTGTCADIRTLAAVTFTRKAAAELRGRFRIAIERAAVEATGDEQARLAAALDRIEQCYIGTIHSFCGRMLRERPVEAEVTIGFSELDDEADARLRDTAWRTYCAKLLVDDTDGLLGKLNDFGIKLADLNDAFGRFATFPDVHEWPLPDAKAVDTAKEEKALEKHLAHISARVDCLPDEEGSPTGRVRPRYQRALAIVRQHGSHSPRALAALFELFSSKCHSASRGLTKECKAEVNAEKEPWNEFREQYAIPGLEKIQMHCYALVMGMFQQAVEVYEQLRLASGGLNFGDLLLKTAALLRDQPPIRRYFSKRFTHLLVDEFQDTDPVQAQVMMYLTATDPAEQNWRACRPRPGSLFVVGDPKQSIYRFRRADIVTYNEVKQIIQAEGGEVLALSTNFRTVRPILEWANEMFAPLFPEVATDEQPVYVAFDVGRQDEDAGELTGVRTLWLDSDIAPNAAAAVEADAAAIANFIAAAVASGKTLTRTAKEIADGISPAARYDDFLIVTRNKTNLQTYASYLQAAGIPCEVSGGGMLGEIEELSLLCLCLQAILNPHDEVLLVAVLRSELFGVSDADLYAFREAGGEFNFQKKLPDEGTFAATSREAIHEAYTRLSAYAKTFRQLPALPAIETVAADLGLAARAATGEGGSVRAGSFCKALELLRAAQREFWTAIDLVEYLGTLLDPKQDQTGAPARVRPEPLVRVMNLHKVKGLEAPVVFLADPRGGSSHAPDTHIDRHGDTVRGYMTLAVANGPYHKKVFACPQDWSEISAREEKFTEAEADRLLYVAATRAGSLLVVSQQEKKNNSNPWQPFAASLADFPTLVIPEGKSSPLREPVELTAAEVREGLAASAERVAKLGEPTYAAAQAKKFAEDAGEDGEVVWRVERAAASAASLPEWKIKGAAWGEVIHELLEAALRDSAADLLPLACSLLAEREIDPAEAATAVATVRSVLQSDILARARASKEFLLETNFTLSVPAAESASGLPTLLRGAVDLAFREAGGWVLVDYKTDAFKGADPAPLVTRHRGQLATYKKAWEECTGESVIETGLYLVSGAMYVAVEV